MRIKNLVAICALFAHSLNLFAAEAGLFSSLDRSMMNTDDARVVEEFLQYQAAPTEKGYGILLAEAQRPDGYLAQNVVGCILYNGYGMKRDPRSAIGYFYAAARHNNLAYGNYGLSLVQAGRGDGYPLMLKAFNKSGLEDLGVQLFMYQVKTGQVDPRLLNRLVAAKNSIGLYWQATELYRAKDYTRAIDIGLEAAERGERRAPAIVSNAYSQLFAVDGNPFSKENSAVWSYIDQLLNDPNRLAARTNGSEADELAYAKAKSWISTHKLNVKNYNEAICIPNGKTI